MLTLPIKKKWFDMILSSEKTEEYREINPYYTKRFIKYSKDTPTSKQSEGGGGIAKGKKWK